MLCEWRTGDTTGGTVRLRTVRLRTVRLYTRVQCSYSALTPAVYFVFSLEALSLLDALRCALSHCWGPRRTLDTEPS